MSIVEKNKIPKNFFNELKTTIKCPYCNNTATIVLSIKYGKIIKYVYDCESCGRAIKPAV